MQFRGRYEFLSNFYVCDIEYEGLRYPSVESAFQAMKTLDLEKRSAFQTLSIAGAKRYGRQVKLRPDWSQVKVGIMKELLRKKFEDPDLRQRLLAVTEPIVEENHWHDTLLC